MPLRPTKIKKIKKASLKKLKNLLDSTFSQFIRLRDSDDKGYARCITCHKSFYWVEIQAGHYISRRHLSTRWEELNVHAQCAGCNLFGRGRHDVYALALMDKYGDHILRQLEIQKNKVYPWNRSLIECELSYYKNAVSELKQLKGL